MTVVERKDFVQDVLHASPFKSRNRLASCYIQRLGNFYLPSEDFSSFLDRMAKPESGCVHDVRILTPFISTQMFCVLDMYKYISRF